MGGTKSQLLRKQLDDLKDRLDKKDEVLDKRLYELAQKVGHHEEVLRHLMESVLSRITRLEDLHMPYQPQKHDLSAHRKDTEATP